MGTSSPILDRIVATVQRSWCTVPREVVMPELSSAHTAVVALHATAGAVALATMGVPMLTAKGGVHHRRWGRVYAGAMGVVVLTAWTAAALRLAAGDTGEGPVFLALVGLLGGASTWAGWRVWTERGRAGPRAFWPDQAVQACLAAGGLAGAAWGLWTGGVLFVAFGALSAILGGRELAALRAPNTDRVHLGLRHISATGAACIGTVTAFLVVNVQHLPAPVRGALPGWAWWLLPTAVGVPLIVRASGAWQARRG